MKKKRSLLTVTLAVILVLGSVFPVFASELEEVSFSDLKEGKWYTNFMVDLVEKGIFNGYNGKINPNDYITRAEYIQMLYTVMGEGWSEAIHPDIYERFDDEISDVKEGAWYFEQMRLAYLTGTIRDDFVEGDYNGKLRPNDPLTREEMFQITVKGFQLERWDGPEGPEDLAKNFDDEKDISHWARDSVNFLLADGYIVGNGSNKLLPKDNLTRAEAAVVISAMREIKELEAKKKVVFK